ncbi:MAG: hypothetical protein ABMA15_02165 [Vicinamibacterales bacterium]
MGRRRGPRQVPYTNLAPCFYRFRLHASNKRKQLEGYVRKAHQSIWDLRSPILDQRGLVTMPARATDAGGHCTIQSTPGSGVQVIAEFLPAPTG